MIEISTNHAVRMNYAEMLAVWAAGFRYICEQIMFVSTVAILGSKFLKSRTVFSVGFDKIDSNKILLKGPDEENTVWIGRRYNNSLEAECVAAALTDRINASKD